MRSKAGDTAVILRNMQGMEGHFITILRQSERPECWVCACVNDMQSRQGVVRAGAEIDVHDGDLFEFPTSTKEQA